MERPRLRYLKQFARNTGTDGYTAYEKIGLQLFQMESCQPIKRLRDKHKALMRLMELIRMRRTRRTARIDQKYINFSRLTRGEDHLGDLAVDGITIQMDLQQVKLKRGNILLT